VPLQAEHLALVSRSFASIHAALLRDVSLKAILNAGCSLLATSPAGASTTPSADMLASCLQTLCSLSPQPPFQAHIKALLLLPEPSGSSKASAPRPFSDPLKPLYSLFCSNWSQRRSSQNPVQPPAPHKALALDRARRHPSANALHAYSFILSNTSSTPGLANEGVVPYLLAALTSSVTPSVVEAALEAAEALAGRLSTRGTAPGLPILLRGLLQHKASIMGSPAGGAMALIHASLACSSSNSNGSCVCQELPSC
jgi:hypothetical protein